jgi:aminoglycoside phosphotransferase family enzyme/predicted kinase
MQAQALPPALRPFLDPAFYPHPVERVEVVQTHISYVFLAGDYAYKVKKAVDFGFLDYSTLARRRYYCRREVELNRRFCPEAYLGVVAVREEDGRLSLEGRGRPVEYAVRMRRVPEGRLLHRLLAQGEATPAMLEAVAEALARAHAAAPTSPPIGRYGTWAIAYAWRENFQQWRPFLGETITPQQDALLRGYVGWFLRRRRPLLRQRALQGRVRECHGDLRSESVVVWPDGSICIMDCIEFSRRLRRTDVAGDVAFLAMDLEFRGRLDLAQAFVARYLAASGDHELPRVLDFYRCYRAAVRGKVEGFLLRQPEVPAQQKEEARQRARRYFALACRYAARDWPALLITCGPAGTGKSALAAALGLPVVSSDLVRKELAGLRPQQPAAAPWRRGLYSPAMTRRTYGEMLARAQALLRGGQWALLDATFLQRWQRQAARRLAQREGVRFLCLELRASDDLVRERLQARQGGPSDADWQIYLRQREALEPPDELPPQERLTLDASLPPQELAATVRAALGL